MQWSDKTARVWVPYTGGESLEAPPFGAYPFPPYDPGQGDDRPPCLLAVVHSRTQMSAAEDAAAEGHEVVIWAWRCPEYIAQEAEDSFPVVYGRPTEADVIARAQAGPGRNELTSLCVAAELAMGLPDVLD